MEQSVPSQISLIFLRTIFKSRVELPQGTAKKNKNIQNTNEENCRGTHKYFNKNPLCVKNTCFHGSGTGLC